MANAIECSQQQRAVIAMSLKRRILVVDDHPLFRAGVQTLLSEEPEFGEVAGAANGEEALARIRAERWDAVVLDISMPQKSGIDILEQIRRDHPELPVLILSMHPAEQYALNLLRAGATGYLTRSEEHTSELQSRGHLVCRLL